MRVVYGAPDIRSSPEQYVAYLKKQLPEKIHVSYVCCGNHYSAYLAKSLGSIYERSEELNEQQNVESTIKQALKANSGLLLPKIAKRVISPFSEILDEGAFMKKVEAEKEQAKKALETLNPNHPNQDIFYRRVPWNLEALKQVNLPILVGRLTESAHRFAFSQARNVQVFDMPIYMPNQGFKIPLELAPYETAIAKIVAAESLSNSQISQCNAYITFDLGVVHPQGYARRDGLHVDGFLSKSNIKAGSDGIVWGDNTYLISDRDELQTECYPGPFDLSEVDIDSPQAVLEALSKQGKGMTYRQARAYDIVRLTTNNVHAVHVNLTGRYIARAFLKMTFSERLFNRGGNTYNPNLDYRFMYVPRGVGRNTQNYIGNVPKGYLDISLNCIDFNGRQFPSYVSAGPLSVQKKDSVVVKATPAREGEMLETIVNGDMVTTNIARAGDFKVTRNDKDRYFLGANFARLYQPIGNNQYKPIPRPLKAVRVDKDVSFLAPWGTRQNIPCGSYIIEDNRGEKWGVHKESFAATYESSFKC